MNTHEPVTWKPADLLLAFPNELLIKILSYSQLNDIIQCRAVSRRLRTLVDTTDEIQYFIELSVAGVRDMLSNSSICLAERITLLREKQARWKRSLELNIPSGTVEPRIVLRPSQGSHIKPAYYGNVVLEAYEHDAHPLESSNWDAIDCHCMVSRTRGERSVDSWTLRFSFCFIAFIADPAQDLLVVLQKGGIYNSLYIVHAVHLSDGIPFVPEPIAIPKLGTMPHEILDSSPILDISGVVLGIATQRRREMDSIDEVILLNWKCGTLLARSTRSRHPYSLHPAFTLVSNSCFLRGVTHHLQDASGQHCHAIELWVYDKSGGSELASPELIATYELPRVHKDVTCALTMVFLRSSCGIYRKHPYDLSPFDLSHDSSVLWVHKIATSTPDDRQYLDMALNTSTFLRKVSEFHLARNSPYVAANIEWKLWGPESARVFQRRWIFSLPAVHGNQVLIEDRLLDFNTLDIYRDIVHARTEKGRDNDIHSSRIVTKTSIIPRGQMYVEDILSCLPYRDTRILGSEPLRIPFGIQIFAGDPWIIGTNSALPMDHWEYTVLNLESNLFHVEESKEDSERDNVEL